MKKKNKEWLKEEINKTLNIDGGSGERIEGFNKGLEFSLDLIEELDQQEVPVIPQFVAEWIEKNRDKTNLLDTKAMMIHRCINEDLRVLDWVDDNDDLFIRAWLDGYSVEKETMYLVKINDQGSCLYLKSMQLYKDVESRTDINSNFGGWKEHAIKFNNKDQAEVIAKFFAGEVVEVTND